ncbi:MAG: L,D-transpeptidase [Brevundimonas sp.]|uniref:L,D-transpeptidase family protein n=1 Tax=Brevundimonas sp. TaxID=1871086 RepID=UPI00391C9773
MSLSRTARYVAPALALLLPLTIAACDRGQPQAPAESRQSAQGGLSRDAIERAVFTQPAPAPAAVEGQAAPPLQAQPDPAVIRAQILLGRARFSPGIIDGLGGENTSQAIAAFEKAAGLTEDGVLDQQVFDRLTSGDSSPVLADHVVTAQDVEGPFIGTVPTDLEAMSELDRVGYATPLEGLAERFQMTEALLQALNPGVDFGTAQGLVGKTLVVAAVGARELPSEVAYVVVDKTESSVRAFDGSDRLIAFYPATIGSTERPAPSGTLTVVGVANDPDYAYDPSRVTYDRGPRRILVPPGPNNPVGSVWIALSRDTYGIHGTPDPSKIAKTASNGCVRMTNWDAEQLAAAVKPGVEVRFVG